MSGLTVGWQIVLWCHLPHCAHSIPCTLKFCAMCLGPRHTKRQPHRLKFLSWYPLWIQYSQEICNYNNNKQSLSFGLHILKYCGRGSHISEVGPSCPSLWHTFIQCQHSSIYSETLLSSEWHLRFFRCSPPESLSLFCSEDSRAMSSGIIFNKIGHNKFP